MANHSHQRSQGSTLTRMWIFGVNAKVPSALAYCYSWNILLSSTCGVFFCGESKHGEHKFQDLAELDKQPPYYFAFASAIVSPIMTVLFFGPPKPTVALQTNANTCFSAFSTYAALTGKVIVQSSFLLLAFYVYVNDVLQIWDLWTSDKFNLWERLNGANLVYATSSNVGKAFAALGYKQQVYAYVHTGMPIQAWRSYFMIPIWLGVWQTIIIPVSVCFSQSGSI